MNESNKIIPSVLIIGGGRWARVYIKEITALPYPVFVDVLTKSQSVVLRKIYNDKIQNYFASSESISIDKKYDLVIIANQPSRRVIDISTACKFSSNIIIEKPICNSFHQYKQIQKIFDFYMPVKMNWSISCPFIYSEMVKNFFQSKKKPLELHCIWNEQDNNNPSYRLDKNISSTALSHFLPLITFYLGIRYDDLEMKCIAKNQVQVFLRNISTVNIVISWVRNYQEPVKKIILKNYNRVFVLDLMNQQLKSRGIYKINNHHLTPLQCQVHQALKDRTANIYHYQSFFQQQAAYKLFLFNSN